MATDLECFRATVEHRTPPRILYSAGFTDDLRRRVIEHIGTEDIAAHYGFTQCGGLDLTRPDDQPPIDYSPYWADHDLPEGTTINSVGVAQVPSGFYHFWGYVSPLRNATSIQEIEDYPLDDLSTWDDSHLAARVQEAHAAGRIAVGWVGHMYETAWQIRGYEQFLLDTIERPAWAECMLEKLHQQNLVKARAFARGGADWIRTGDDVANQKALMFAPDTWRRLIFARWAEVYRLIKDIHPDARIWYHSDGNILPIVGEMADAGLDILNPLQPECLDIDAVHRRFGRRLTLDGCIGTQSTMPWGTPEDVRARVKEVIEKYGRDGGLMIAPTHVLEPEVPLANIDALCAACRDYGTFE